ncbi:MAG: Dipeptide transport system permease protein DppC, partial [uncultured Thermomicrobiales bacterium]
GARGRGRRRRAPACRDRPPGRATGSSLALGADARRQSRRRRQRRLPPPRGAGRRLRPPAGNDRPDLSRPRRPPSGTVGRPPAGHGRPGPRRAQPRRLRRPRLAAGRVERHGDRGPRRLDPRPPLRLLPAARHADHADARRADGVSEHPAGDRDHGQPRPVDRQRRRRPGRRLHADDRPVGPLVHPRRQATGLRRIGASGRNGGRGDPAPLRLPERSLAADRPMHLRRRLRDHLRGVALFPRGRRRPGDRHLGQHAARRPAHPPACMVALHLSRHRARPDRSRPEPPWRRPPRRARPACSTAV